MRGLPFGCRFECTEGRLIWFRATGGGNTNRSQREGEPVGDTGFCRRRI
jgi:hypothetical protein